MKDVLDTFIKNLIPGKPLVLFLDYDGTLDDFAPTPDDILPNPEVIKIMERLVSDSKIHPILLSGRKLEHLRALLPVDKLCLAGTYGLEIQPVDGTLLMQEAYDTIRPTINRIKPVWQELIQEDAAFFLEDKGWSLAIHGKFVNPETSQRVLQEALHAATPLIDRDLFQIIIDEKFLEAAPILANKGNAVLFLVKKFGYENMNYLYIGDDEKDELGMQAVQCLGGSAIKVADTQVKTTADWYLENPQAVRVFLNSLPGKI
ncbi:MAG: trehalose-phosphatase [Anaerolineaceae bacterium]|nr:trehalose-phosphatase [Anaerolineaceae bacterium]